MNALTGGGTLQVAARTASFQTKAKNLVTLSIAV